MSEISAILEELRSAAEKPQGKPTLVPGGGAVCSVKIHEEANRGGADEAV